MLLGDIVVIQKLKELAVEHHVKHLDSFMFFATLGISVNVLHFECLL